MADGVSPTDVNVIMKIENGVKSIFVKVDSENSGFVEAAGVMGLTAGEGLDLASEAAKDLENLFPLPEADATEYTFSMSEELFLLLNEFDGTHRFTLKVIDKEGNEKSAVLTITVNK